MLKKITVSLSAVALMLVPVSPASGDIPKPKQKIGSVSAHENAVQKSGSCPGVYVFHGNTTLPTFWPGSFNCEGCYLVGNEDCGPNCEAFFINLNPKCNGVRCSPTNRRFDSETFRVEGTGLKLKATRRGTLHKIYIQDLAGNELGYFDDRSGLFSVSNPAALAKAVAQ